MRREAAEVLAELDVRVSPEATVGSLSLAEQQLVEIARAVRRRPRLLILDEPTSALAAGEARTVLEAVGRISASGVAVIYVSHRLDEIRQVARSVTVVRDGSVVDTVDVQEATTTQIVALMLGQAAREQEPFAPRTVDRSSAPLLSVRGLTLAPKLEDIGFDLYAGEVLGIGGLLGSGRSELLRSVAGFEPEAERTVAFEGRPVARPSAAEMKRLGVGMTPEDRKGEGIVPLLGVGENMTMAWFAGISGQAASPPAGPLRPVTSWRAGSRSRRRAWTPPSSTSAAATSRRPSSAAGCTPAAGCCSWTNPPEAWTSRPSSRSTG